MRTSPRWVLALVCLFAAACGGQSPTAPAPAPASLGALFMVADRWDLPVGGGAVPITVVTASGQTGGIVANIDVMLAASAGELSATHVRTDNQGRASVTWNGTASASVTASAGSFTETHGITVAVPPPAPPSPPVPVPAPAPEPTPAPQPAPAPRPLFNVFLGASGTPIAGTTDVYPAGAALEFAASVNSNGAPLPSTWTWGWDFDGNGSIDLVTSGPAPQSTTHAYATGIYHPTVTATAPDGTAVRSSAITVKIQ